MEQVQELKLVTYRPQLLEVQGLCHRLPKHLFKTNHVCLINRHNDSELHDLLANQSICLSDTSKRLLCVLYNRLLRRQVNHWFREYVITRVTNKGLHSVQGPVVVRRNPVTEFLERNISGGLLTLPCLVFWNYAAQKNFKKLCAITGVQSYSPAQKEQKWAAL